MGGHGKTALNCVPFQAIKPIDPSLHRKRRVRRFVALSVILSIVVIIIIIIILVVVVFASVVMVLVVDIAPRYL